MPKQKKDPPENESDDEREGGFYSRRQRRLARELDEAKRLSDGFKMLDSDDDSCSEEEQD